MGCSAEIAIRFKFCDLPCYACVLLFTKKKYTEEFTGRCPASNSAHPLVTSAVGSFEPLHVEERLCNPLSSGALC